MVAAGENAGPVTQHHQPVRMVHNRARVKRTRRVEAIIAVDDRLCPAAFAALVEKYKQAILAAAFRGDLTRQWREAYKSQCPVFSEHRIGERVAELSHLDDTWCWAAMDDIAVITGGLTKNPKRELLPHKVPYLRVANVYANELRLNDVAEIGCTGAELEKTRLHKGDLLVVEGNGSLDQLGRVAIWNDEITTCSHQNHIIRVRPRQDVAAKYVLYWLLSPGGRNYIEAAASSSSGLHTLSISKVGGLPIPFCATDEQHEAVRLIDATFAWINHLASEATSARKLTDHLDQAVLAKAFRGELVPQDPNDEPASVLLQRIRAKRTWHVHQRRKGSAQEPYINHLLEVATLVAEATGGADTNLVVAALLHDAIEDCEVPRELIADAFGEDVASVVEEVTDDKSLPKVARKEQQVKNAATKSPRAKILKLADKTSNLRAVAASPSPDWSVKRRIEYIRWARDVAIGLRGVNQQLEKQFDDAALAAELSFKPVGGSNSDA